MEQISFFDGSNRLRIDKPIRLIELFAGYGSQALALKYLGVSFEHYRICEWAVKSIQAYKDMHFPDDDTDYSRKPTREEVENFLSKWGISADYNVPMTKEQIKRMGEKKQRQVYNNIIATHNLVSVCNCKASDLGIESTDRYTYIMTYSFPCQDLSLAGKQAGMERGGDTRSGLLWEVERLLLEMKEKPQILVMENVPNVIGARNIQHFAEWLKSLENMGYKCYWKCLNAKDYGVPQSRNRCFMVSVLGDAYYEFPKKFPLEKCLKDVLEERVSDKYFLSDKMIECMIKHDGERAKKRYSKVFVPIDTNGVSRCLMTTGGRRPEDNYIKVMGNIPSAREHTGRVYGDDGISPTLTAVCGGEQQPYIEVGDKVRRLTPREYFRLMGVKDEDFDRVAINQSDTSLYHLAGDSIVVNVLMQIFNKML